MAIKVLHFYDEGTVEGGQQKAQYYLLKALDQDKEIIVGCALVKKDGYYTEKMRKLGINIIPLNIKNGYDLNFKSNIIEKFKEYDIHHFHDPSPNIILYSLMAGNKVKRVFTRRGGIARYGINIKKQLKFQIKKILIKKFFDGFSGNSLNAVISLKNQYGIKGKKIFTIYNGIDFDELKPTVAYQKILSELGLNEKDFIIGTSGRLVELKRVDLIVRAFFKVNITSKKLLIIGDGPKKRELENLIISLGIKDKVIFLGSKPDIGNYLQILNAFILASNSSESFGNSVVEAMFFKIPCVVMIDSPGLLEHIKDKETGFVANDENDLAKKIEYIATNKELAAIIGDRSRLFVIEKYSLQNLVNNLKEFYSYVLYKKND